MIERDINCRRCKLGDTVSRTCLLGEPLKRHKVMIILDAPTRVAAKRDEVTPDRDLVKMLEDAGVDIDSAFFCYAVSCHTEKPTKSQVKQCKYWLDAQIGIVKPKFVLLVGSTPLLAVLGKTGIRKERGKPVEQDGRIYFSVYSPGYVAYDERQLPVLKSDLRNFAEMVEYGSVRREENLNMRIVLDQDSFEEMLDDLQGIVSYDIETSCLYPWAFEAQIVSLGFGTKHSQWILPVVHPECPWDLNDIKRMVKAIDATLDNNEVKLVAHNGKFDFLWTWVHYGVRWHEFFHFDTMLAHYLLDENAEHGLKILAKLAFNAPDWDVDLDLKHFKGPLAKCAEYQAHDLYYTRKLYLRLKKELKSEPGPNQVLWHILMPCARLFTEIEKHGVYFNIDKMEEAEVYLRNELKQSELELKKHSPDTNWRSPKQLTALLFGKLGIKSVEKTKKGADSVSESVLKRIDHPVAKALLRYRAADKQLSSFIEGWKPFIQDSRLHPSFKLHGTVTGRLSCEHPNLQQVPRDPRIRSLITAPEGWVLLEVDLSQIELRIAAELANETNLLNAFFTNTDPHWLTMIREMGRGGAYPKLVKETASTLTQRKVTNYGEAIEIVFKAGPDACQDIDAEWKELRKKAKAVNFGYLFGMWWKKFMIYARDNYGVIVTEKQAQESRESFFDLYPEFEDWHEKQRKYARRNGYVNSLSGRKRRLPAAMSHVKTPERMEAERQAINSPVQSFANELNLMSLIQLREEFSRGVVKPVATVHDAILIEVREDWLERVHNRLLEIMRQPKLLKVLNINLSVPIEADAKVGPWGAGVSLSKWKAARAKAA